MRILRILLATILYSPTEHNEIPYFLGPKGLRSSLPEKYGADFLIICKPGVVAIQRKEFPGDFFASYEDGRLTREMSLLATADFRLLALEGEPLFTSEGVLVSEYHSSWTKRRLRNLLRSARYKHGVDFEWTNNTKDTADLLLELEAWFSTDVHKSLLTRPKLVRDTWGQFNKERWAAFFLQGFPGIGADRAAAIYALFGRVPLRWDITKEELKQLQGIGDKTADRLWELLESNHGEGIESEDISG